jgi:hypothetical protein
MDAATLCGSTLAALALGLTWIQRRDWRDAAYLRRLVRLRLRRVGLPDRAR